MKKLIFSILFIFVLVFNGAFVQALNIKLPLLKVVEEWSIIPNTFIDLEISPQRPYVVTHLRILPLSTDHPVIHPMLDFYQQDRRFSNLFSTDGKSMLCGPTSLANVLVYLKYNHIPKYEKILKDHKDELKLNADWVPFLYCSCGTDRNRGTSMSNLRDCAKEAIVEGGYNTDNVFIRGSRSSIES